MQGLSGFTSDPVKTSVGFWILEPNTQKPHTFFFRLKNLKDYLLVFEVSQSKAYTATESHQKDPSPHSLSGVSISISFFRISIGSSGNIND